MKRRGRVRTGRYRVRRGWLVLTAAGLSLGCAVLAPTAVTEPAVSATAQPIATEPPGTPGAALATAVSDSPAAGICAETDDPIVTVTIFPDIPDPRCTIIRPEQRLRLINQRGETIEVSLAGLTATLEAGAEHVFEIPFGQLLAPGVHAFQVSPCCGAELWLQDGP
jgi:hypothetical protein